MKKTNSILNKAVITVLAGSAMVVGAMSEASAHVAYNTYNAHATFTSTDAGGNGTDGWVWGGVGATSGGNPAAASPGWVGTSAGEAPLGYVGAVHLNWAAMMHHAGGALEVSQQHAFDTYGIYADIDTAGGAWLDAEAAPQGWRHNTDIGLFKSDVTQNVTLNISAMNGPIANFGVSVFEGMATNITGYTHHGAWNNAPEGVPPILGNVPIGITNPFGSTGLDVVVGYDDTVDGLNGYTFLAEAGKAYSIYLGGSGGVHWNQQHDGYIMNISSSPVPVPAAVWLFGSGLVGLIGLQRRKQTGA